MDEAARADAWVLDGNFEGESEFVFVRAQALVWLDYPLPVVLWRSTRRNLGLWLTREPTWSGNVMTLPMALRGIRHAVRSYRKRRRLLPGCLAAHPHVRLIRLSTPREAERWLAAQQQDRRYVPDSSSSSGIRR